MAKKHDLSEKKVLRLSHAVAGVTPTAFPISVRELKFWLSVSFGPT
jgi:hypothetical protein